MADMITRCPACSTSFRITEAQLKTAKGAVRCGACLHVFRALDHLTGESTVKANPSQAKPAAKPSATPASKSKAKAKADRPQDFPRFEYKKPAAAAPANKPRPAARKPAPAPDKAADDAWDEPTTTHQDGKIEQDDGMENMLRFDQSVIDEQTDASDTLGDDDDLLISDDFDEEETDDKRTGAYGEDLAESFIDLDSWQPKEKSLFERKDKPRKTQLGDDDDDSKRDPDESWALKMLEEDDDEDTPQFTRPTPAQAQPIVTELDDDEDYQQRTTGSFEPIDDDQLEEALGEPLDQHYEPKQEPRLSDDYVDLDEEFSASREDDDLESLFDDEAPGKHRSAMLHRIEPEPVEFHFANDGIHWRPKLLWGGLSLLGLLLLVVQIGWLQFDNLSRKQPYRDLYSSICPLVGCEVPAIAAPNLIRTTNFMVREHPEVADALMVDTILLNTANFDQPFPDLVLSFSDLQGNTVASRRFTPEEYLSGEMAGRSQMPSNQPVHLALEIANPGAEAVNYSAYIPR